MLDPLTAWSRMVSAGLDMQSTWLRGVETVRASGEVIEARMAVIRAAAAAPRPGDHAELSRLVPEKVEAFGRSAQGVARDVVAMHAAWATHMQRVAMMMLAGRLPTPGEATTLAHQSADYALGATTAAARLGKSALAPIHRTATGNARRLRRGRAR